MNKKDIVILDIDTYDNIRDRYFIQKRKYAEIYEKIYKIKTICETWNFYLPDEALEELKEILKDE